MQDHRPRAVIPAIGTWVLNGRQGPVEFIGEHTYVPSVSGNLWKFLEGGSKSTFVDPQYRFVLFDAEDEILRGDAQTGELKTTATLARQADRGLRHSKFVPDPVPIFVFENGLAVFDSNGDLRWAGDDLKLDHVFEKIMGSRIIYSSEHHGPWAYDLSTGMMVNAE